MCRSAVRRLASLALIVALLAPAVAVAQEWKAFTSREGRYTARFPGEPTQQLQTMPTNFGNLQLRMAVFEQPKVAFYAVAYADYPRDKIVGEKTDALLNKARDGAVNNVKGGKLVGEKKIAHAGFPGRDLRIEAPGDVTIRIRMFLVRERLYQAVVVVPGKDDAADAKRFFAAFSFQKP